MAPLLAPLLAFMAGIVLCPYLDPRPVWLCLPLAALIGLMRRRYHWIALFLLGAGVRGLEQPPPAEPATEASRVIATIARTPEWRGLGVYMDLNLLTVDDLPAKGRARLTEFLDDPELLQLFNALDLKRGDRVEIVVRLRRPAVYRNPGVFNFRRFLERQGIYWTGTIRSPRLITVLERGPAMWRAVDDLRNHVRERLGRYFKNDPEALGLAMGMVLGRKHDLTGSVERRFQEGGLYHMVVVSGFNLAVVAAAAALAARLAGLQRGFRLLTMAIAVVGYAVLVDGDAPVIRASVMACVLIVCKALDRGYSTANSIALSAFILLLANPSAIEDTSFQMTFTAVVTIAFVAVPAARWALHDLRTRLHDFGNTELDGWLSPEAADWRVARRMWCEAHGLPRAIITVPWRIYLHTVEALIVSISIHFTFVYFMVESFHRISPVSPLLNVPAGVIAAVITPLGLVLIALPEAMGIPVAWLVALLVRVLLGMLDHALALPFSNLRVPSPPSWIWAAYGLLVVLAVCGMWRQRRGILVCILPLLLASQGVILLGDFTPPPPPVITVTFLDVGQGDSTLVEFPDGKRVLIDGGGVAAGRFLNLQDESSFSIGESVVSAHLFSRGIRRLDAVALTHAHHDHLDGLSDVLSNFEVGELWLGKNPMIPAYRDLIDQAQQAGVPLRFATAGSMLGSFAVLHPPPNWRVRRTAENNDSLVLLLEDHGQTALFTGDLELPLRAPGPVSLLKVSHHGSRGVRMRVRSELPVISVGANNPFGHPHPSNLPALRTDVLGAIKVELERPRLRVSFPSLGPRP